MIWLSSFPRSGNTFFRNVLFEVYGLESSSYYDGVGEPENYVDYPIVKTHMRPGNVHPSASEIKALYLVRDGRDALVSMAHQRIDIYDPESNFRENFIEAMLAAEGSYFGGWSINVEEWIQRADVLIRFEELILTPIAQVDRLNEIFPLPEKNESKLPSFQDLKFGKPKYGRGKRLAQNEEEELEIIRKSFRKGKSFGWRQELDKELQDLFWAYHRSTMDRLGYDRAGKLNALNPDMDFQVMKLLGQELPLKKQTYHILIEANKLLMHQNDGVKRYLLELLKAMYPVSLNQDSRWQIDVYLKGRVYPLKQFGKTLFDPNKNENHFSRLSKISKGIKSAIKIFIPKSYHDTFSKYFKKVLMKLGLGFAKYLASMYYLFERLTAGKETAKQNFDNQKDFLELGKYDLIHVPLPQHYGPFTKSKNNYLVTIHDLTHSLHSEHHTANNINRAEKGMEFFCSENSEFLCISESTKRDLLNYGPIDESKTHLVYEAADNQKFRPNLNANKGLFVRSIYGISDKPFLFTLSTIEPRKNLINTVKAFELLLDENPDLDINLVIGGKNGWKSKELFQVKHRKHITFTGFIDENDLPILYNEAEALCYISFYEGFGLPPLEAMSCKTPVIYGDNSSMKELFEGYALPAIPEDIIDIKNQMKAILTDKELKARMEEKSLERSFDFSWRKTAIDTLATYEKVILKNLSN